MMLKEKILFSKEECDSIINIKKSNQQNWIHQHRNYMSEMIDYNTNTKWIFDKLNNFFELETKIEIFKLKPEIHFHKFSKGDWFGVHNDIRDGRLYAVGVLLNDTFQGGDFKLYNPIEYTLNKKIGNCYIFDVRINHEITPILGGERYSLLWFLQKHHIKFKTTNSLI